MNEIEQEIARWGLTSPPYFIVYRPSDGFSGYQSLFYTGDEGEEQAVGLVFSSSEIAERFLKENELETEGWEVGELADWQHVVAFIEGYPILRYISQEKPKDTDSDGYVAVEISVLLPLLRELAMRECRS
jgi:hypothetical protein